MRHKIGDGITYRAEIFRVKGNTYSRLEREGYGYIVNVINDELVYVYNGVRTLLVHREDIIKNHNKR